MRCILLSQRCISSRQLTDNIFEIETTALAHVACAPQESGILLMDFAATYSSDNHAWTLSLIEKTELPDFISRFLRSIYNDSTTYVEFAGATRGQSHGQWCKTGLSSERFFFFAVAFDPTFRLLQRQLSQGTITPEFLAAYAMWLRRRLRCGRLIFSGLNDCTGSGVSFRGSQCLPQFEPS